MNRSDLVSKFAQSIGVERAGEIVDEAAELAGVGGKETYTGEEVRNICAEIQHAHDGYVSSVANEIRVQQRVQHRFEVLLENIPDPAVVVEFDGDDPVITSSNSAFCETFGYDPDRTNDRRLESLFVPVDATSSAELWGASESSVESEVRRRTAADEVRTYLFRSSTAIREEGTVEGYGIYTDITERKRRERKLEHQNEQLERFVSVVSHDLQNPLNVASGYLELAVESTESEPTRERLSVVRRTLRRMETLIEQLLTLAKQGRVVGEPATVELEESVELAWSNVQAGRAILSISPSLPTIEADRERLCELLQNLFRNAIEHAGEDATITVSPLSGRAGTGFAVEDDGPGIPADDRDEVFEHGFSTDDDGTGFGLSIVRSIAVAHGWSIDLTDGEGGGARFEIVCDPVD